MGNEGKIGIKNQGLLLFSCRLTLRFVWSLSKYCLQDAFCCQFIANISMALKPEQIVALL